MTGIKHFRFTLNNYTPEEVIQLQSLDVKGLIYGHEYAPTTGTPHLQGYVILHKQIRWSQVKAMLPARTAFFTCEKSPIANILYATKDLEDVYVKGVIKWRPPLNVEPLWKRKHRCPCHPKVFSPWCPKWKANSKKEFLKYCDENPDKIADFTLDVYSTDVDEHMDIGTSNIIEEEAFHDSDDELLL